MRTGLPLLALLTGCFTPEAYDLEVETLSFSNAYTTNDDIVMEPASYDLPCPDGESSSFYAVYRKGITTPAPLVIVFHSGALDYVDVPSPETPTAGNHHAGEDRLSADWANDKIFETFGLLPGGATTLNEINDGVLPAVLADAGAFTLYPGNCWGDLWHNESGYTLNDPDEFIDRNGRVMAWAMLAIASSDTEEALLWKERLGMDALPVPVDFTGVYLVGLGEGGRAVVELLRRGSDATVQGGSLPPIKGVLLDSTIDDLTPLYATPTAFPGKAEALSRIYTDGVDDLGHWSLGRWYSEMGITAPLQYFYSSNDPQVPPDSLTSLFAFADSGAASGKVRVTDVGSARHIQLNAEENIALTNQAVGELLTPTP